MSSHHTLSLPAAILININIMLGAGMFINTVELAKRAGSLGGFAYFVIGILLLPLVASIAQLVHKYPSGGFYVFAQKEISPAAGFISAWSYFMAKLASATLMIHASVSLIARIFPVYEYGSPLMWDIGIICFYSFLNLKNVKTSSYIQNTFIFLKSIPILFAIISGFYLFFKGHSTITLSDMSTLTWSGIPLSLPLVLYAATGFEASCSISSRIRNAAKNAPYAIFISYGIVMLIEFLYQTLFYAGVGTSLAQAENYLSAFPLLLHTLLPVSSSIMTILISCFHLAIASSALGGAYGILFSNSWNLYALAQHHHLFFSSFFTKMNKHLIPFACILAEGLICILYLYITKGSPIALQQTAALGSTVAYTISVIALLASYCKNKSSIRQKIISVLGLSSCSILIYTCIKGLILAGLGAFIFFLILISLGISMFCVKKIKNSCQII